MEGKPEPNLEILPQASPSSNQQPFESLHHKQKLIEFHRIKTWRIKMQKSELIFALSLLAFVATVPVEDKSRPLMELECRFGNFCDQFV